MSKGYSGLFSETKGNQVDYLGNDQIKSTNNFSKFIRISNSCNNCASTSFFEPYEFDTTIFHIFLSSVFKPTTKDLKLIGEIANCNYIKAKKLIENAPVEIFCGKAFEIKKIKKRLELANIDIHIEPDFPY